VLQFLPEIESDMSVFHRVEDIYTMRADRFFRRVSCLAAYDGALATRKTDQERADVQVRRATQPAAELTEEQAWDAYRRKHYAKYLEPGERIGTVDLNQFLDLMSQPAAGR
jgi:hypothetical protein